MDPGPLEKADHIPKIAARVKNSFFDKFEGTDFKHDNSFLKVEPKNTQRRHFWSLIFSRNFAIRRI